MNDFADLYPPVGDCIEPLAPSTSFYTFNDFTNFVNPEIKPNLQDTSSTLRKFNDPYANPDNETVIKRYREDFGNEAAPISLKEFILRENTVKPTVTSSVTPTETSKVRAKSPFSKLSTIRESSSEVYPNETSYEQQLTLTAFSSMQQNETEIFTSRPSTNMNQTNNNVPYSTLLAITKNSLFLSFSNDGQKVLGNSVNAANDDAIAVVAEGQVN